MTSGKELFIELVERLEWFIAEDDTNENDLDNQYWLMGKQAGIDTVARARAFLEDSKTPEAQAKRRIRKFVGEYRKMRGLDPENIYEIHAGDPERQAKLTVSDLEALVDEVELRQGTKRLVSLESHNSAVLPRGQCVTGGPVPNGIACPLCGNELMDSTPWMTLASLPPQYNIHCPACNFHGYRY